jgi:hypothetical protein
MEVQLPWFQNRFLIGCLPKILISYRYCLKIHVGFSGIFLYFVKNNIMVKMKYPYLNEEAQKIPISIKPGSEKLIFYKDVVEGEEKLPLINELSENEKRLLTIARFKSQPGLVTADLNGNIMDEKSTVLEIKNDTPTGKMMVEKEMMYLEEFLKSFH